MDRLTHRVHILEMNGESYHLKQSRLARLSQRVRKRVEEVFGWVKTVGSGHKLRYRGVDRNQLTYTVPMPSDGAISDSASVLDFVKSGVLGKTRTGGSISRHGLWSLLGIPSRSRRRCGNERGNRSQTASNRS